MWISRSSSWRATALRARRSLVVSACVGVAVATPAWGAQSAGGETEQPSNSGAASCPASNPPNELTLTAGTPQTATMGSAFATALQVTFANSDGCPLTTAVAGIPVTFSAPSAGASGSFSASGSNAVTVGSDASGTATAPTFTANNAAGGYPVTASSPYGSISFSLTNVEVSDANVCGALASTTPPAENVPASVAQRPTKLTVGVGATQATPTGTRFAIELAVTVTNAERDPVAGALVTFAAPSRGPSGYFTVRSGGTHTFTLRAWRSRRVELRTDACGIALAPPFTAGHREGGYVVVASVGDVRAAFALVNEGR